MPSQEVTEELIACKDLLKQLFTEGYFEKDDLTLGLVRRRLAACDEAQQNPKSLTVESYQAQQSQTNQRIRLILKEKLGVQAPGHTLNEALDFLEYECGQIKSKVEYIFGKLP
jgi:hypothetical protein